MIKNELFELTQEQIAISKKYYKGKIIKCLIAPYHTSKMIEELYEHYCAGRIIHIFPENNISYSQLALFIDSIITNNAYEEHCIITSNMNIISDIINPCVRILTVDGEIKECYTKTFAANIHTIKYDILEEEVRNKNYHINTINKVIDMINNKDVENVEYINQTIELIGEPVLSTKLSEMASSLNDEESEIKRLEKEIERLKKLKNKIK